MGALLPNSRERRARGRARRVAGLVLLLAFPAASPPQAHSAPTREGLAAAYAVAAGSALGSEDLVYEFGWMGVPAAEASWRVSSANGESGPILAVEARARTLPRIDTLWKLRSQLEATLAADPIVPSRFLLRDRGRRHTTETVLAFDHQAGEIDIRRERSGRPPRMRHEPIEGQYDPVSAVFLLRSLPLEQDAVHSVEIQTRRERHRLDLRVIGRERVTVKAGTFDAVVLAPTLREVEGGATVRWLRRARLWVTDDDRRVILKLTSDVFIGEVRTELVSLGAAS